jgi:integrase
MLHSAFAICSRGHPATTRRLLATAGVTPAQLAQQRLIVLTLAYAGLRFGELAALQLRRVDLMRRRLEIAASVTEVTGVATFGTPKTGRERSVPFPRFLVDDLTVLLAGKGPEDLVFTAPEGEVLRLMGSAGGCSTVRPRRPACPG